MPSHPPSYADLGKSTRDIFNKGYHFGLAKLDFKTKTQNGVELNVSGTSNQDTGKALGNLESKYKVKELGLTFTEKWNTDNILATEVALEDQLTKGLKLSLDTTFNPITGKKSGSANVSYKRDYVNLTTSADVDVGGPVIHAAAVLGYNGWLVGHQLSFDTTKSKLTKNNFAIGYAVDDFVLHTNVNDGQEFGGSIYQKVNSRLQTGVQLAWTAGSTATRFGLGCKYILDNDAYINAKVNNSSQIGLGYTQKLRPGINLTLSALIDGKNFNQGGHKLGIGLELEP
ncbi:Voltage-dependent anion-selective channel protein 2 [Chamberlinius hualienensis]